MDVLMKSYPLVTGRPRKELIDRRVRSASGEPSMGSLFARGDSCSPLQRMSMLYRFCRTAAGFLLIVFPMSIKEPLAKRKRRTSLPPLRFAQWFFFDVGAM